MIHHPATALALLALAIAASLAPVRAEGLGGSITLRADYFPESPQFEDQSGSRTQGSVWGKLDGFYRLDDSLTLDVDLRGSWTPEAQERAFGDVEKGILEYKAESWGLRAGVLNERWGVMTVEQIADIVNQRDYVSNYRGRDRLGQPGLAWQYYGDSWSATVIAATYKRERRLARGLDRFRNTGLGYTDAEFDEGRWSPPDLGLRLFKGLGDLELELTYFHGTAREPLLLPTFVEDGSLALTPTYRQMRQGGIAARYVLGDFVFRGEGYLRDMDGVPTYGGLALGVERVLYRVFGGVEDLLIYVEGYYDDRPSEAPPTLFDNDLVIGLRLNANDAKGTELWLQMIVDYETGSNLIEVEAKRRLTDSLVARVELVAPVNVEDDSVLSGFERDSRLTASITFYF
jgi:hypothetical protein